MTDVSLKEGERVDFLVRENLKIIQSREVFSFGIDAVLLARFPKIPKAGLILDLCAGNGAVGLMASKETQAKILEVEIQERLADMAERSVRLNDLEEQLRVICDDLVNTYKYVAASNVDLIFCNPPYFKVTAQSQGNENQHFNLARHELATDFSTICQVARQMLKPGGHFALIHRPERFLEISAELRQHNLSPKRLQFVYPRANENANLVVIDAVKDGKMSGEKILPGLIIHGEDGNYTEEINQIYYGSTIAG